MSEISKTASDDSVLIQRHGPSAPPYRGYQTSDFDRGRSVDVPNNQGGGNYNSNSYPGQGGFVGTSNYQSGDAAAAPGVAPRSDATIQTAVLAALSDHNELDSSDIHVEVQGGTIVLTGAVRSDVDRNIAGELSLSASGVLKVDNQLRVNLGH